MNQLNLFSEEEVIHNEFDSFDISNIPDNDFWRKNSKKFSNLPKNTYFIFKTGGINPYMEDKGPIFPYIQNVISGKIIKVKTLTTDLYVRCNILNYGLRIHRIAAQAFIPNPRNCIDVDHIDGNILNYCLNNLRWVTRSENMKKINRNDPKYITREENLKKKGNVFD